MHRVEKGVKGLELSLEPHQGHQFHADLCVVEVGLEGVVDVDLEQPPVFQILVVWVGADAAHPQVPRASCELELNQVHAVGVLSQQGLGGLVHLQVGGGEAQLFFGQPLAVDDH